MPVLDGSFEAFVTNLGKYNEGELVGEWVHFPTTEEEMKKVFERIGIGSKDEFGQIYEEWFITDYDCSIHGVSNLLGEYENLDKLNYLASLANTKTSISSTTSPRGWMRCPALSLSISWQSWIAAAMK